MFLNADEDNLGLSYLCKPAEPGTGAGAAEGQQEEGKSLGG